MATITLNIPDAVAPRVMDAYATLWNYEEFGAGQTKAQFAKAKIIEQIKNTVGQAERKAAAEEIDASIDIT